MVLIHGGGWWRGCRNSLQDVAWEASAHDPAVTLSHYYITLVFDYRLACNPSDPNLQDSPIRSLCGWYYPTVDSNGSNKIGPATHDVEDAVTWAKTVWPTLPGRMAWNGRVVMLGTSAGGTLVYSALAPSPNVGGAVTVNTVGAWSGALRFDRMTNNKWPCDADQTNDQTNCIKGEDGYLQCSTIVYPDPACITNGKYPDASPISWYTNTSLPHAFIANGGGPDGTHEELVSLQSALDFRNIDLIGHLGWQQGVQFDMCIVDNTAHGRGLRQWTCDDNPLKTVWQRTADFLQ